ncbi:hypothetical protein OPT61_g524 [Boeremia exigua]|uniref:Uncharacterized protein n=1 Tax=Boeremia exigua TaxID=749465 RepID=A0ACC2ITL0_9PLEO|nr:hypothetical protein OPT61_g524 [Boeremia exigua]
MRLNIATGPSQTDRDYKNGDNVRFPRSPITLDATMLTMGAHNTTVENTNVIQEAAARHHDLPLLPPPSQDEIDPLRWPHGLKIAALTATAFANFTANFAGAGLSVAMPVLQAQFNKTPSEVNSLLTFNFLLLGLGNLIWVPFGVKYGKRASLLVSTLMLFVVLIWSAKSIVPGIVSDIFFFHERATMMSGYTILIASATAIGPLVASFIVQYSSGTWVDYMWVCAALAGVNMVAIFFAYPESNFRRHESGSQHVAEMLASPQGRSDKDREVLRTEDVSRQTACVVRRPWTSIWKTCFTVDPSITLLEAFLQPLIILFKPSVLLAVYLYGTSLASQIILIFAFPELLMAPPYLFSSVGVGLMEIAAIIGFILGCLAGGWLADVVTSKVVARQNGQVYPEQRLVALVPGAVFAPAGCIIIALACAEKLHWIGIAFGFGMVSFGTIFTPNIAITYVVECYPSMAAESLVMINVFKNLVAFLFLYTATGWIAAKGWIQVYMIMFMLSILGLEAQIQLALQALKQDANLSQRRAAAIYRVPQSTLSDRRAGRPSRADTMPNLRGLDNNEEQLADMAAMANSLRAERNLGPVGTNWPSTFVKR